MRQQEFENQLNKKISKRRLITGLIFGAFLLLAATFGILREVTKEHIDHCVGTGGFVASWTEIKYNESYAHIDTSTRIGKCLHGWLYKVNPVRFSASSADIPALRYTFEVVLIAAAAVRPVPGGLDPALIEDEIATAATVHSNLPSILMGLGKGIHKLLLGIKKILDLQHVVKLAFNLVAQAKLVDLEIAGIRSCGIPGIHCVVSEVVLQISGHIRS